MDLWLPGSPCVPPAADHLHMPGSQEKPLYSSIAREPVKQQYVKLILAKHRVFDPAPHPQATPVVLYAGLSHHSGAEAV